MNIPQLIYSFYCWWTFGFFSSLELLQIVLLWACSYMSFVDIHMHFSWVYTKEWSCWGWGMHMFSFSIYSQLVFQKVCINHCLSFNFISHVCYYIMFVKSNISIFSCKTCIFQFCLGNSSLLWGHFMIFDWF